MTYTQSKVMAAQGESHTAIGGSYRYKQQGDTRSIRLLRLQPGPTCNEESSICISLEEYTLDSVPRYEALSYTWASENGETDQLILIDCQAEGYIMVTANCEAALQRLRRFTLDLGFELMLCVSIKTTCRSGIIK
jgi:hypothetical protein